MKNLIHPPPKLLETLHFVSQFHTREPPQNEYLVDVARDYLREKAVVIDMTPTLFDAVFRDLSLSTRSYLQKQFEVIGKKTLKEDMYYLTFNRNKKNPWQLNKLQVGITDKLLSSLKKAVSKVADKISFNVDSTDLDLPEKDLQKLRERDLKLLEQRQLELAAEREAEIEEEKKIQ